MTSPCTPSSSPLVVGGVDTHKDLHVAAVVDAADAVIATESFSTTRAGYRALLRWMRAYGDIARIGVECTGSYGAGLMRQLNEAYAVLGDPAKRRAYDLQSKVKQFVPPVSQKARESFHPGGAVDLLKLAGAFVPPHLQEHVMPTLKRVLSDRGITPEAATVEQVLQSAGILKPQRKRRAKRA